MKLFELENNDVLSGYYDPADDTLNTRHPDQTRHPRLFLRHLNRLKKMRALKKLKDLQRQDLLGIIYATPDEQSGGGMSF